MPSSPSTGYSSSIELLIFLTFFHSTFLVTSFGRPVTTRVLMAFGSPEPEAGPAPGAAPSPVLACCCWFGCLATFLGLGSSPGSGCVQVSHRTGTCGCALTRRSASKTRIFLPLSPKAPPSNSSIALSASSLMAYVT